MTHDCKCGQSFDTLTRYRIHQADECRHSVEIDVTDDELEEITEEVARELLICEFCETKKRYFDDLDIEDREEVGLVAVVNFHCEECGASCENTAILS